MPNTSTAAFLAPPPAPRLVHLERWSFDGSLRAASLNDSTVTSAMLRTFRKDKIPLQIQPVDATRKKSHSRR